MVILLRKCPLVAQFLIEFIFEDWIDGFATSFHKENAYLLIMALEIRRTPVLTGESAKRFLKEIKTVKAKFSKRKIEAMMAQTAQMRKNAKF